jgi:CheY-like chemotaxis protein
MSATKDIPVVAITAAAMKHEVERAKDAGFAAYLTKPIDVPETLRVIQKYLASDNPSEPNTPSE